MKRFPDTYNEAYEKSKKYTLAPRAGWVEPGKRTKDNEAILVRRQEAVRLADDLAQACYGKEIFLQEMVQLRFLWSDWPKATQTASVVRSAIMFTAPDGWKGDAPIAKRRKRPGRSWKKRWMGEKITTMEELERKVAV